jgi:hypothetical protein
MKPYSSAYPLPRFSRRASSFSRSAFNVCRRIMRRRAARQARQPWPAALATLFGWPYGSVEGWQSGRMRRSRKPFRAVSSDEGSNPSPSAFHPSRYRSRLGAASRCAGGPKAEPGFARREPIRELKRERRGLTGETRFPPCYAAVSKTVSGGFVRRGFKSLPLRLIQAKSAATSFSGRREGAQAPFSFSAQVRSTWLSTGAQLARIGPNPRQRRNRRRGARRAYFRLREASPQVAARLAVAGRASFVLTPVPEQSNAGRRADFQG